MAALGKLFERRVPAYLGGLLISLAAMLAIFQAKRALMPTFHTFEDTRPPATMKAGGKIKIIYGKDPGYLIIPGLPSTLALSRRGESGNLQDIARLQYSGLVDREPSLGPIPEPGHYQVDASIYICAQPGVAHCTNLKLRQELEVSPGSDASDLALPIDLSKLAEFGLAAGQGAEKAQLRQ